MPNPKILVLIAAALWIAACNPVGSDAWCEDMKQKSKGSWTQDETVSYAKYCVLGMDPDKWCEKLEKKPKGEWTADEAADYAKNCVLGRGE